MYNSQENKSFNTGKDIEESHEDQEKKKVKPLRIDKIATYHQEMKQDHENMKNKHEHRQHEAIYHSSTEHIPREILAACAEMNREIVEVNSEFKEAHAPHLAKSKQEILQTAIVALDRAPQGELKKALLLGVGNGLDIPLQELAEKFDHLTVVELDRESTENAIKQLPPELQKKFRLVVADITGISGEFCQGLQDNTNISKPMDFFIAAENITNNIVSRAAENIPNVGNDYAFVCSHLVLSQLAVIPEYSIQNTVSGKLGMELYSIPDDVKANFPASHQNLIKSLQREHIRYLAKSVTPLGTVHLADTYAQLVYTSPTQRPDVVPMVIPKSIDPVIKVNFTPMKEKTTDWIFNHTPGKLGFLVKSHTLESKQVNA